MSDVWDQETGKIASLAILEPTADYKDCCGKRTKEEKAICFTQLLNSNNICRPVGDIRAHFRNMKHHDLVMVKSVI